MKGHILHFFNPLVATLTPGKLTTGKDGNACLTYKLEGERMERIVKEDVLPINLEIRNNKLYGKKSFLFMVASDNFISVVGDVIYDEEGKPILETITTPKKDEKGNPVIGKNGKQEVIKTKKPKRNSVFAVIGNIPQSAIVELTKSTDFLNLLYYIGSKGKDEWKGLLLIGIIIAVGLYLLVTYGFPMLGIDLGGLSPV